MHELKIYQEVKYPNQGYVIPYKEVVLLLPNKKDYVNLVETKIIYYFAPSPNFTLDQVKECAATVWRDPSFVERVFTIQGMPEEKFFKKMIEIN